MKKGPVGQEKQKAFGEGTAKIVPKKVEWVSKYGGEGWVSSRGKGQGSKKKTKKLERER